MARQDINVSTPNDGLGDPLRDAFVKTNANFTELYAGVGTNYNLLWRDSGETLGYNSTSYLTWDKINIKLTIQHDGVGIDDIDGLKISNTTAASFGNSSYSPMLNLHGQGWGSGNELSEIWLRNEPLENTTLNVPILSLLSKADTTITKIFQFGTDPTNNLYSNIWSGNVSPTDSNYIFKIKNDGSESWINSSTYLDFSINSTPLISIKNTSVGIGMDYNLSTFNGKFGIKGDGIIDGITFQTMNSTGKTLVTMLDNGSVTFVGSGGTVFSVMGESGELFSVVDSLIGDIFTVNDISGIPILTVNSDETVTIDGVLKINSKLFTSITGSTDISTISMLSSSGAFFDYYIKDQNTGNMRLGTVMVIWDGATVSYTDVSTVDVLNDSSTEWLTFSCYISGNDVILKTDISTDSWDIKIATRLI